MMMSVNMRRNSAKNLEENNVLNSLTTTSSINNIDVDGTHIEMGIKYGKSLKIELIEIIDILKNYFIKKHGVIYEELIKLAKNPLLQQLLNN